MAQVSDLEGALTETLQAGLLSESHGPAGTEVSFPPAHPGCRL